LTVLFALRDVPQGGERVGVGCHKWGDRRYWVEVRPRQRKMSIWWTRTCTRGDE